MSIYKINESLPTSTKISELSDMILELDGQIDEAKYNLNEVEELYSGMGLSRRYLRNVSLGHTLSTYGDWSLLADETGYSIWKLSPANYDYDIKNELYFDDKILSNKGDASSETATTFSGANGLVYVYDGSSYIDHTSESGTEGGTAFNLIDSTGEFLYLGSSTTFKGIKFEFNTRGSNYTNEVQLYHSGAGWVGISSVVDDLEDNTSNFESDGNINWALTSATGAGWIQNSVNSQTKYWARIKTTTVPITTAKVNYLIPADSVIGLLSLSSSQVEDEDWSWCTYESAIYVTIRNSGATAYEGDYYITSSSTNTNKQNFFIYNHEYLLNHLDSRFVYASINLKDITSFKTFSVSGQQDVVADTTTDTMTFATGSGITITTDAATDTITFNTAPSFASSAETSAGINTTKVISPNSLSQSIHGEKIIELKAIADTTALTSGSAMYFFIPSALNGMNLVDADAGVHTPSTGAGLPTIALYNVTDSQKILSTNITIDLNEKTSYTAVTQPVINTNYDDVATGDEYRIDVDVAGPGALGLDVILVFKTP